jgi:hypothetical protein
MEGALTALGPYPFLQLIFGVAILGLGVWSIIKGLNAKGPTQEDQRADWAAREQLKNLEENSWKLVHLLEKQNELLGRLAAVLYNDRQLRP